VRRRISIDSLYTSFAKALMLVPDLILIVAIFQLGADT
jgi:hypothetical protein